MYLTKYLTFAQKALKVSILCVILSVSFSQDGQRMEKLYKSLLQRTRADMQELLSHCAFGNMQIFSINAEGFGREEKVFHGRDIERL